ncbi:putative Transcriptional regulator (GntR family protein) [Desulfamplus magnetovallimortis]|uniref:Putative Transcriptional regulator (GntR family protein) n=1 Tax=Desulfamplus magnetovallimortis TaxID=1246637 RepID=A0A1W1HHI1_9BACT|nr:FadR/GntR family transcriptional regulator [Desulfamplus magnetovallimortis]SLM31961.1 putative Transcriptional regulator (GntR family protein) [Desulfamplus magnetovallimortis]
MNIPIQKITATEAVVDNLRERIITCEFEAGEKLPSEQSLLKQYNVSRLTLREALAKLSAWGVIDVKQGKGAYISENVSIPALDSVLIPMFPQKNPDKMNELVEARNLLESEITARVAVKRTSKDIAELENLLTYDNKTINSVEKFAERDYTFHLTLSRMAGNEFFHTMYQALNRQIRFFLLQYARSITDWKAALERHIPILEAIIEQNEEKARTIAREHARICASYIHKRQQKYQTTGEVIQ